MWVFRGGSLTPQGEWLRTFSWPNCPFLISCLFVCWMLLCICNFCIFFKPLKGVAEKLWPNCPSCYHVCSFLSVGLVIFHDQIAISDITFVCLYFVCLFVWFLDAFVYLSFLFLFFLRPRREWLKKLWPSCPSSYHVCLFVSFLSVCLMLLCICCFCLFVRRLEGSGWDFFKLCFRSKAVVTKLPPPSSTTIFSSSNSPLPFNCTKTLSLQKKTD